MINLKNIKIDLNQIKEKIYRKCTLIKYHFINHDIFIKDNKKVILFIDGYGFNGGLTDRFKAIISIKNFALKYNLIFKLKYDHPFHLEKYMLYHNREIIATGEDLKWSMLNTEFIYIKDDPSSIPVFLKKFINRSQKNKIFIYTNLDWLPFLYTPTTNTSIIWANSFKELFTFNSSIIQKFEYFVSQSLNSNSYIILHARFTTLLNDFIDVTDINLSTEEENLLMKHIYNKMLSIADLYKSQSFIIFSDSKKYLDFVQKMISFNDIKNMFIYSGSPKHTDRIYNSDNDYEYEFVTFYFMINAKKIYQILGHNLYKSQFPLYASYIKNCEIEYVY
jgi:hypothetical protein